MDQSKGCNRSARGVQIKPYFEGVTVENIMFEEMAEMSKRIHQNRFFPPLFDDTNRPDELRWFLSKVPEKARNLPDIFMAHMGALIISEAMRDVLVQFNLGQTQIIELPLYELSAMTKRGRTEADRSKQDPRRWFLLHVVDYKTTLVASASEKLHWRGNEEYHYYDIYQSEAALVGVDYRAAKEGPDLWLDPELPDIYFFSDPLKRAIQSAKLRAPILKFKSCLLI